MRGCNERSTHHQGLSIFLGDANGLMETPLSCFVPLQHAYSTPLGYDWEGTSEIDWTFRYSLAERIR